MSPKLQKGAFYTILVLLLLFLPLTFYSVYLKMNQVTPASKEENTNKDFFFAGKLWFYDEKGTFLGTYTCENKYCGYGVSYENDTMYGLDAYQSTEKGELPIINNQYAFLRDTNEEASHEVFLFDIKKNIAFKNNVYASVKNYQIGLQDNLFIVENNEHLFGVLEVGDFPILKIPANYEFLGVANLGFEEEKLIADYFVGLKDGEWMIIDQNDAKLTNGIEEMIKTFNGEYIITKIGDLNHHIVDYENNKVLPNDFRSLSFVGRYLACTTGSEFYIYDLVSNAPISEIHTIFQNDKIETEINSKNQIVITINGVVVENVST